jgi:hypothetical protein
MSHLGCALAAIAATLATTALSAQAPNDDCVNPLAIVGPGTYSFDLTQATAGQSGVFIPGCDVSGQIVVDDLWFCWTATCNGLFEISTCGQTSADTVIRIYAGCGCPLVPETPLCCSDDDCKRQTRIVCDATCGQTFLIQIGRKAGGPTGAGTFTIACLEQNCDQGGGTGEPPDDCNCCGTRPPIVATLPTPFNPGLVGAATNFQLMPNAPAVYLIDLGNAGSAPLGTPWGTQRYSHPNWSMSKLGGVFGVTIDDVGNVYAAHTSVYGTGTGFDQLGTLGGAGSIYALNGTTGAATELIRLPNNIDPAIVVNHPQEAYPGLGNLTFDCRTRRLYAANLEDGRIYAIDPAAATKVRSTYDIATGTITGPLPNNALAEPGDPPGWEPWGKLPYAVKVNGDRLYYSVWSGSLFAGFPNTIRSVQLDAIGDFVPNTDRLEIVMPPMPGYPNSNAVVDITFDDECCLYAAERGISFINSQAHTARVMRFCPIETPVGRVWDNGFTYQIGHPCTGNNSAGGVGFEPAAGGGRVWTMGDALNFCNPVGGLVYGIQGQPKAGAPYTLSALVDLDGNLSIVQKHDLGSLEVTCLTLVPPCASIETVDLRCGPDDTFQWTFTFTNQSGTNASVLILPEPAFSPNVFPLIPPVANGSQSQPITVTITGQPGTQFCFDFILGDIEGNECCHLEPCIELPDCECADVVDVQATATSVPGVFQLTFTLVNYASWSTGHVVFIPTGGNATFSPAIVNPPPIPPFGSQTIGPVTVSTTVTPGGQLCFTIGNHSANWLECCFKEVCVFVPSITPSGNPADLNGDGVVNAADLAILLGAWGSAGPGDLDGDGVVGSSDLAVLLGAWG